ncbi:MAG: hypothetical protein QOI98_2394, partial [Solirubrobacteraceae bacterium]|nr:hypothetical protein [Solirubrobacteraceae bacterium]
TGVSDATPPPAPLGKTSTLRIKLISKRASAARAKKGRTLSLRLRSTEKITKLAGRIVSGASRSPVVYGVGRLSRINGNGTLRIKLRRPLHKGSYRVDVTGRKAKGQRGTRTLHLAVH